MVDVLLKMFLLDGGRSVFDGVYNGKYLAFYENGAKEHEGKFHFGKVQKAGKIVIVTVR